MDVDSLGLRSASMLDVRWKMDDGRRKNTNSWDRYCLRRLGIKEKALNISHQKEQII